MRVVVALALLFGCGGSTDSSECRDGEERACYQGPADTRGIGVCTDGIELCANGGWSGTCVGDVTPFVERCNGSDDDCNGTVDDAETTGDACTSSDGCPGTKACLGTAVTCLSPGKNECGACGGPTIPNLGMECSNAVCTGVFVCGADDASAVCNAPQQNACEQCGGPVITNLNDPCTGVGGCAGARICNASGTGTVCSCNPFPGECMDSGALRAVVSPVVGDLVITEVMPGPSGDDTLEEWFEVRVTRDIDLNQVALDRAGDANPPNVIQSANCLRVTAGSTLVFARSADPAMNNGLPAVTSTFTFSLVTTNGDIRLLLDTVVLDAITWPTSTSGRARQLDPDLIDPTANDNAGNFCDATTPYGTRTPQDLGTPGAANVQCALLPPAGSCLDGNVARPIVKPAAGALVITELLANPAGTSDSAREWVEIANTSGAAFDLNEITIARAGQMGSRVSSPSCLSIAPGAFGLFARSNDPAQNAMLPAVDATFGFSIVDSNGDIELRDGTQILDAVTYASSTSGVARQLDPDFATTAGNDVAANHCAATTAYGDGSNLGTPKAANAQCP